MLLLSTVLLLIFSNFSCGDNVYPKMEHTLTSPYMHHSWIMFGSTIIQPEYIRLTSDTASQKGGILNNIPVMFHNWEVAIAFHVHGSGRTLFGDGFAFWYTDKPLVSGSAFGSWERFRGLGIFFDTYANQNGEHAHEHPYISAMVNDGHAVYDHDKDGTHTQLAGCSSNFRHINHAIAKIRYVKKQLTLTLSYPGSDTDVDCFVANDVSLPIGYYFGASAATGDLSDNHDIISIRTYEVEVPLAPNESAVDWAQIEPSAKGAAPPRERVADAPVAPRSTRIVWFMVYLLLAVIFLAVVGIAGYLYYERRRRHLKRLY